MNKKKLQTIFLSFLMFFSIQGIQGCAIYEYMHESMQVRPDLSTISGNYIYQGELFAFTVNKTVDAFEAGYISVDVYENKILPKMIEGKKWSQIISMMAKIEKGESGYVPNEDKDRAFKELRAINILLNTLYEEGVNYDEPSNYQNAISLGN